MKQSDKLKVLIDSIKTANELAAKQIEKNRRSIELLGEFITEPESLGKAPYSDNVPSLPNMVGQEIELGNEWFKDETIKPKDMKAGEWYVKTRGDDDFMFKFKDFDSLDMNPIAYYILVNPVGEIRYNDTTSYSPSQTTLRKATQQEVLKYFPNELEVPTHGGNDAGYIQEVTDTQL